MSVKRYVGDKLVGLDADKNSVLSTVSDGANYYCTDSRYNVYIKENGAWQQISGGGGGGGGGSLAVNEVNDPSSNVSVSNVNTIQFDVNSGFALSNPSSGVVKVAMESTFKTWHIFEDPGDTSSVDIVAHAVDEIDIKAGTGITLAATTAAGSKGIVISAPNLDGASGTSGTSGTSGSAGTSGSSSGTSGSDGTAGNSKSSGTSGSDGTAGESGSSSGTSGSEGTSGNSKTSGTSGSDGTAGDSKTSGT